MSSANEAIFIHTVVLLMNLFPSSWFRFYVLTLKRKKASSFVDSTVFSMSLANEVIFTLSLVVTKGSN